MHSSNYILVNVILLLSCKRISFSIEANNSFQLWVKLASSLYFELDFKLFVCFRASIKVLDRFGNI